MQVSTHTISPLVSPQATAAGSPCRREAHSVAVVAQAIETAPCQRFDVFWHRDRDGRTEQQGVCRATVDRALQLSLHDAQIVPELATMQWLLDKKHVLGKHPDQSCIVLRFSGGAPAKLAAGTSSKTHLYSYAYFLRMRYHGAALAIERNSHQARPTPLHNSATLSINAPAGTDVTVPGMGPVRLTHHVMQQFRMRLNHPPYPVAWAELQRLLTTGRLQPLPVSDRTSARDQERHRHAGMRLIDPVSQWVFVLVEVDGKPTLVTAYIQLRASLCNTGQHAASTPVVPSSNSFTGEDNGRTK